MRTQWLLSMALVGVVGMTATLHGQIAPPEARHALPVVNQELQALAEAAGAKPRFAAHRAQFTVEKQEIAYRTPTGEERKTVWVIKDGKRNVAVYSDRPQIDLITGDPATAPEVIDWPVRYHNATFLNTRITTIAYVDRWGVSGDTAGFDFSKPGAEITLTEWQRWTKEGKFKRDGQTFARHTLRVDPVLGYVIDVEGEMAFAEPPVNAKGKPILSVEVTNFLAAGMSDIWPGSWRLDNTFYSRSDMASLTFRGWKSNLGAADISDNKTNMKLRDAGLVGFIDKDKPAPVIAHAPGHAVSLATCNVWQDQHNHVTLAEKPDKDGVYRTRYAYRFAYMPPEMANAALERTRIDDFNGARFIMIRFGRVEDFEDQPLPLTVTDRAGYATAFGPKSRISEDAARSGKKALHVKGFENKEKATAGYNGFIFTPQFNLKANTAYRVTCYVKLVGEDMEAYVTGDLYEYTPHQPERVKAQKSNVVKIGEGWQKIELEFTTPAWDPFIDLRLIAAGKGDAYFDDFEFVPVKK